MEGDGMVAIVQGLKDAGLAVTLMNQTHLMNSLKTSTVPISKSSVETSTNAVIGRNTAAQVRDGHFASSYQLAHCNVRPSSPPERLPEFPPQRPEPSRNQGNFQVGGYASGELNASPPPLQYYGGSQGYRGGMIWPDRGSVSRRLSPTNLSSKDTDKFVNSLRRYPLPISPERSVSSELVQRLLSYTQNKYSSKNSNVRSPRLLRDESPTRDQKTDTRASKNIQTYTRAKKEPSRDSSVNTHNEIKFNLGKKGRSFSSTSPYNVRTKGDRHDTYDYLKTSRHRHPEVRYLSDVKKCIRDTIKQMYADKPLVCPQISRRYNQHKKEHHKNSKESCDARCDVTQASSGTSSDFLLFSRCQPPTTEQPTCPRHKLCCVCKQTPCVCEAGPSFVELTPTPEAPEPEALPELPATTDAKSAVCSCKAETAKLREKTVDIIFQWLKSLPVYADDSPENKAKREKMVKDLADQLNNLEGDKDYERKAKEEIKKCVEKLPMWYPEAKRDQEMFKKQIVDEMFKKIAVVDDNDSFKDTIAKWVAGIEFEQDAKVDKDDVVDKFVSQLIPMVDNSEELKSEIEDILQELPIVNKNKVIKKLTDKLVNDLTNVAHKAAKEKRRSTDFIDSELEEKIMDWLEDIPELYTNTKENKMMVKSLAEKLMNVKRMDLDEKENQERLKEEVLDWIDGTLKKRGEKLDSKTKTKLTNKLLDHLKNAGEVSRLSLAEENDYENQIWEWLDDVVDIPENDKKTHKKVVNNFAKKLQELHSENADDEVMVEEIMDFLEVLSKQGVTVSSKNKNKFAKKLVNKINSTPKSRKSSKQYKDLQQSILSEISDLVDDIPSNISKSKRKEITSKIADILAKNINHLANKNDNIDNEIVNILEKEAKMPESEASDLASAIINRVQGMTSDSQISTKTDNDLKQLVAEEVSDILNDYNINIKKKKVVEKNITELMTDQIMRGADDIKLKDNIISVLQDANVSEDDALDISNKLLEKNKELSLSYRTQDSKLGISKPRLSRQSRSMSPMEKYEFEEKAEKEILDFIEDITGDDSSKTRKKRKRAAGELVHRLGEIMSDPDETDKAKSVTEEIFQYLRKLSIESDMSKDEMARKLACRLLGKGFKASTPKKSYSFHPKRDSMDISSISIDGDDSTRGFEKPVQVLSDEEKTYVKELTDLIQSWIDDLPIDFSATEDKGYKETMIQDLASDIIDRQKYLQLNPDAKTSDQEELEHLKYQIFRWLNKLLDTDDLSSVMQRTDSLMRKIKDVHIPELVSPIGKRAGSKSGVDLIRNSVESIKDEISIWLDEIPQNMYKSTDKNFITQMIQELAEKIQQFRAKNQTENIHGEISNWLSKLIKDSTKLDKMIEDLEARLKQRGWTEVSFNPSQDSSQFIEENLEGGIKDWLKTLPLFLKRNSSEKRELESFIPELAKGIKSVILSAQEPTADVDKLCLDEIIKHLKKFPMDEELKSDPDYLQRVAAQLLHYLKSLQILTNISDRQDRPPDEYLKANLDEWVDSLPIPRLNSTEMGKFENLKKEFEEKVKQIRQEPENEQRLKDIIKNYLLKFPIEESLKENEQFINDRVELLIKNLLAVPIETILEHSSDKFVKKAVANWIKSLPIATGKTIDDIPSNAIAELTETISYLLVKTDTIQMDEIKQTLENAIETFLKSTPLDPNVHFDVKSLAKSLFNDLKEMSRKRSSVAPQVVKKAADVLFDNIESWVDNLPLKGSTPEEFEKNKKIKQEIASKVIHKIGELNMNPEVFNDDFLYDDMLEDEIDNLLTDLSSEDIKNNLPAIKKDLMEKVKEARQKTREEVAGQAYKQQLREAISKTLPSQPFTDEEQASFEVLKDNLADAFINLHYVGGNKELKNKYKTKINEEVTNFCNDYLKKHPSTPIDSKKLNQDLYNALKSVPIPKEETVRHEVELVKIKDEVNDWIKELPLKEQTPAEIVNRNKMVAVLAKKIHDIEKMKAIDPDADYDGKMRKEITKWIKKQNLDIDDAEATKLTDKLINNLKSTEQSRRVSASTRYSIEPDVFDVTPGVPSTCNPTCAGPCRSYVVPPSTLSFEEQDHLQKIRERSPIPRIRYPPCRDASVSPLPIDAGSQTEIRPWESQICGRRLAQQSSGVQTQRPPETKMMQAVGSQAEVTPHVIVKEYYWDVEAAKMQEICGPCPSQLAPPSPHPPNPQMAEQASQGVCSRYPNTTSHPIPSASPSSTPCPPTPRQMAERPMNQQASQGACSQCPYISPRSSIPGAYGTPTPQPRRPEPCYRREMPGTASDLPEPGTSSSFRSPKARITRLGSFDDMQPKCSRSRMNWSKFPEDEFWGEKPRLESDEDDEPFLKERKKEEEKIRCRCRERILTKCSVKKRGKGCQSNDDVKRCSKCCGVHCPYPSYLYFRQ